MGTRRRRVSVIYFISKLVKWHDLCMEIISNPTQVEIKKAAQVLRDGNLVAFPTETVYGLGADATNKKAVGRIYSVKGRPTNHPLIVHISSITQLDKWAIDIPKYALKLAEEFWPGPMTLILSRSNLAKNFITGSQESIGLRVPSNPVAVALLSQFENLGGEGVAAPSANKFGAVSATTSEAVYEELGQVFSEQDLIINGGKCEIGIESTIIDCTQDYPTILRPGYITLEMVEDATGFITNPKAETQKIKTSGQFKSHYSPAAEVVLGELPGLGEGFIALKHIPTPKGSMRLASPKSTTEFAQTIYDALRLGDKMNLQKIAVFLPEENGLGIALKDRLVRAANNTNKARPIS
jgi:L-threonylcarbamoyladenylate synthase